MSCNPCKDINECQEQQGLCGDHGRCVNLVSTKDVFMFLKPVWVGKIHGVGVYATHVVRIWWFSNKFSLFQLKRM